MNTVHSIPFQDIYSQLDVEEDDYDYYGELEIPPFSRPSTPSLWSSIRFNCQYCVKPTLEQSLYHLYPILYVAIVNQVLIRKSSLLAKWINLSLSILVLYNFFNLWITGYMILLVIGVYFVINLEWRRFPVEAVCMAHLLAGYLALDKNTWLEVRGAEMILVMKLISLRVDFSKSDKDAVKHKLNVLDYFNYILSINTAILGPWISYDQYRSTLSGKPFNIINMIEAIKYAGLSVVSLSLSNCLLTFLEDHLELGLLATTYLQAFSFRQSNYFILYLSQSLCSLSQIDPYEDDRHKSMMLRVVDPIKVEIPRSMMDVVTSWNIPMHKWLKKYVFVEVRKRKGIVLSILATYFVSAALHGFDVYIVLVLFSIGVYAYLESVIRSKLAKRLEMCVGARECKPDCSHVIRNDRLVCKLLNAVFTLLNIYHLAYLGQLLYSDDDRLNFQRSGLKIAMNKWSSTYYSGHLMSIFLLTLNKLI